MERKLIVYNKLVRDKIPNIIKANGKHCNTIIVPKEDLLGLLEVKLNEEVNEYLEAKNIEELADIMEVVYGIADTLGYSEEELAKVREEKKKERGSFKEGVFLKTVY